MFECTPVSNLVDIVLATQKSELMQACDHRVYGEAAQLLDSPSCIYEDLEQLPPYGDINQVVQVPAIFQARYVVPFANKG
jgi:hypothetical protein